MKHDCLFIGNAIVDILSNVSFDFMSENGIETGSWRPIGIEEINQLQETLLDTVISSGGSAANSAVGFTLLGGKASYIGRVKDDDLGRVYVKDMEKAQVNFASKPSQEGMETGRCLVYVTPDAQRSMRTYLGAASQLSPEEIEEDTIAESKILYLEGYLWDEDLAKKSCQKAFELAKKYQVKTALSLSDPFCVEKWREEFRHLVIKSDIVFGNEEELKSLYNTEILSDAIAAARSEIDLSVITRGKLGSIIINENEIEEVPSFPCEKVIDTTGAGDLFAAGFLFGMVNDKRFYECANLGSFVASQVISFFGPRPEADLRELAIKQGLLV
ncbi:MAG: adenosine kinase [Pseudomonadota bacterium]|nr:adenosine kinase [Pseudomonadota bacterium]